MGQHHRREDHPVMVASPLVPRNAVPAGLGYPPPTSYRPHPVTGVPTPPRMVRLPAPENPAAARLRHRAPLAVAVLGTAVAVVGGAAQLPTLTAGLSASGSSGGSSDTHVQAAPAASATTAGRQCATVVADALDTTVTTLGRTDRSRWASVVDDRESGLAATYGSGSPEYRAYVEGVDDIVGWMRDSSTSEDYGQVTVQVARRVAATCGYTG